MEKSPSNFPTKADKLARSGEAVGRKTVAKTERIGKVLVAAEAGTAVKSEKPAMVTKAIAERQVAALSRNELLTLSEKVIVEGSTLHQVYETNLISERGLRRLLVEYLRGGDVVQAFKRELVEREIDFERDPALRDTIRNNLKSSGVASPTLTKLLAQAGVSTQDDTKRELAQARAATLKQAKQQSKLRSRRKLIDIALVATIGLLLFIIIALAVGRM